jgi:Acetyltransferase (GNAT) domain
MAKRGPDLAILTTTEENDALTWIRHFEGLRDQDKDIHFTLEYARAYQQSFRLDVFLAVYSESDSYIMMPFLLRNVHQLPFMAQAAKEGPIYDMASLYSFGGPIERISNGGNRRELYAGFQKALTRYCLAKRIITQFTAFHPLLENHSGLESTGSVEISRRKAVVWIDLQDPAEALFRDLSQNHRRSISKAIRFGVKAGPQEWNGTSIAKFIELYRAKMDAVRADPRWSLPETYCDDLATHLGADRVCLFGAKFDGRVVAMALAIYCKSAAYYHFVGGTEEARHLRAQHLLVYELALWAKAKGCQRLHLGGGNDPEDGIFRFKAGFSNRRSWFYTSNAIYDTQAYSRLCEVRNTWDLSNGLQSLTTQFFPAYRR